MIERRHHYVGPHCVLAMCNSAGTQPALGLHTVDTRDACARRHRRRAHAPTRNTAKIRPKPYTVVFMNSTYPWRTQAHSLQLSSYTHYICALSEHSRDLGSRLLSSFIYHAIGSCCVQTNIFFMCSAVASFDPTVVPCVDRSQHTVITYPGTDYGLVSQKVNLELSRGGDRTARRADAPARAVRV